MKALRTNQDGNISGSANIALKGILGVKAMAEIARALGEDSDATEYDVSATLAAGLQLCEVVDEGGLYPESSLYAPQLLAVTRDVL